MGDFNTCLLKGDSRSHKLQSLLSSYNLHILPLSATHHFPNCTPSLLDIMIVSSPDNVSTHGQLAASYSYHDLVYLSYRIRPPKRKSPSRLLRNFKGINAEALLCDAGDIDWSKLYGTSCINEKISVFNNKIIELFDRYAPVRRIKIKHNPAPWLTPTIKNLMARRDKAKRRYKRRPTEFNLNYFKTLRNRCSRMCRDAKRRHFHISLVNRSPSETWRFLKSVGIGKSVGVNINVDISALNKHFANPPFILDMCTKRNSLQTLSSLPLPQIAPFQLSTVSAADVKKSLLSISSSAVGSDNLCSRMIIPILPAVLPSLTHVLNHSISSGSFPDAWKRAHIIPLPKTTNPTLLSQFRPISILPFLSKVLEHIVHRQLSTFLSQSCLLNPFQSGFRPGHSTVSALIKVTDDIRWAMESKQLTLLVLLDFSNAFNSVDFDIMLGILKSINCSPSTLSWFDSYLRGRSQRVHLEDFSSEWCNLVAGVPQGGVLSPLLFSIFINSVTSLITSNFHLYADDLQLYCHFPESDVGSAIAAVNRDLAGISDWAKNFGLQINPEKSQAMIIGSRKIRSRLELPLASILLNDVPILVTDTAKNLGVILDCHLSWSSHINEVSRKVHYTFHTLKCLQHFLPLKTKISLAQSLIQPIIDYADACYLDATEELLNKLERLQNLCIRFIFNLKKFDHVSEFRNKLKWLPIRLRRNTRILCLLYNVLYSPTSPSYLRERFSLARSPDTPCRSNHRSILKFPSHKTDFYSYSFTVHAVRLWNSLPSDIRASTSVYIFKRKVRQYYLSSDS